MHRLECEVNSIHRVESSLSQLMRGSFSMFYMDNQTLAFILC